MLRLVTALALDRQAQAPVLKVQLCLPLIGQPLPRAQLRAPAVAQLLRTAPAESPGHTARLGASGDLSSRDGSLGEVDPNAAMDMVHFLEEDGMNDEDYDDGDGPPPEEGEEDEEYLPPLEPSEENDSQGEGMPGPRLGRRDDGENPSSMEEELRVLEQLRAMEQIISEVLDPQEVTGRPRREGAGTSAEDLFPPMANLRIRMGGGGEGRVETYTIRRGNGGSRGSERPSQPVEAIRGDLPAFVRAADSSNPTSSLDHPVVERLGAADFVEEEDSPKAEPMEMAPAPEKSVKQPQIRVRFCLHPAPEPEETTKAASTDAATSTAPAEQVADAVVTESSKPVFPPIFLPATWNLLKAMQFLNDQYHLRTESKSSCVDTAEADDAARDAGAPACLVQALQKVSLKNWSLGYALDIDFSHADSDKLADMDVDAQGQLLTAGKRPKKRRRTSTQDSVDEVAREMYTQFTAVEPCGGDVTGPHQLIARCCENTAVTDAIELLHLLKAQGPSLGIDPGLWVSSKLDKKLRYQLEDPLSVVSGTLPFWATTLPRLCPFIFSLKTRKMLLKYTAFGPSFAVHWTQDSKVGSFLRRRATVQTELNAQMDPRKMQDLSQELSNIEEHVVKSSFWLGTLQSTLVRLQKGDDMLRQSEIAMELVCNSGHLVEVQFEGETGFGSAVTQSFYVEVAQLLQDRATNKQIPMWLEDDDSTNSQYLLCRRGLVIRALMDGPQRQATVRRFRFLGRLMGQALREGLICPLPLAEEFFALMLGEQLGPANFPRPGSGSAGEVVGVLADFVADLTAGMSDLSPEEADAWRKEQGARTDFGSRFLTQHHAEAENSTTQHVSFDQYTEMVGLIFVETGLSGPALCADGENVPITIDNVCDFVEKASQFWFDTGVKPQIEAFRAGLNDVFPFECLVTFSRSELREMFCGEDRIEWDEQQLLNHLHPVGGLTDKSPTYKFLVAELLEMAQAERARFLDFVSSCPRLPPGGIAKFHVDVFPDSASKQGYPRSRACANQLYLPPYGTKEELHEKLHEAMHSSAGHHEQRMREM